MVQCPEKKGKVKMYPYLCLWSDFSLLCYKKLFNRIFNYRKCTFYWFLPKPWTTSWCYIEP